MTTTLNQVHIIRVSTCVCCSSQKSEFYDFAHHYIYFLISYITAKGPTLQPPGSFIPLDLHHLLKQDFVEFEVDEYVGYELDDPEMYNQSGDATYIYATIIEKLPVS